MSSARVIPLDELFVIIQVGMRDGRPFFDPLVVKTDTGSAVPFFTYAEDAIKFIEAGRATSCDLGNALKGCVITQLHEDDGLSLFNCLSELGVVPIIDAELMVAEDKVSIRYKSVVSVVNTKDKNKGANKHAN